MADMRGRRSGRGSVLARWQSLTSRDKRAFRIRDTLDGSVVRSGRFGARESAVALSLLTVVLGTVYARVVNPGLPYDEPSHWSTVLFYAHHYSLPVLGQRGVTYEAQQGPVAYFVDAAAVHVIQALGLSVHVAFRVVRVVGVLELAGTVLAVAALIYRMVPSPVAATLAVAVFALNPMLLTMSASVQNDTLALLLGFFALLLAHTWLGDRPSVVRAITVAGLSGLAVLTKLTVWPIVVVIPVWLLWRRRGAGLKAVVAFVGTVAAVTGWWFIRNWSLYGDPTASAGVHKLGLGFAPYHSNGLGGVGHVVEQVVTYLWLPTEYVRNTISAPTVLKAGLLVATLAIVAVGIRDSRRLQPPALLVLSCGVVSVVSWLALYLGAQATAPRIAYLALPMWTAFVGLTVARVGGRTATVGFVVALIVINAWTLIAVGHVAATGFGVIPRLQG
jgi:D-alanyl-D-alanine carboxypeptidase (penicillin-binding protein 5/6)